jgi:hypothetical protein
MHFMEKEKEPQRNKTADQGKNNDPGLRDQSQQQPGVQTRSSNDSDESDQRLTKTASDNFREDDWAEGADADLDSGEKD